MTNAEAAAKLRELADELDPPKPQVKRMMVCLFGKDKGDPHEYCPDCRASGCVDYGPPRPPRRMQGNHCPKHLPVIYFCKHNVEHDYIDDDNYPVNSCDYHGCKPVDHPTVDEKQEGK